MKLPNPDRAIVSREKIVDYLLSATHPRSQRKAAFFLRFGFRADEWQVLAEAIRAHCLEHDVADTRDSAHGILYTVEGELKTPAARHPLLRTVWFVASGSDVPRLVSAYPLPQKRR